MSNRNVRVIVGWGGDSAYRQRKWSLFSRLIEEIRNMVIGISSRHQMLVASCSPCRAPTKLSGFSHGASSALVGCSVANDPDSLAQPCLRWRACSEAAEAAA